MRVERYQRAGATSDVALDTSVPALIVKIGHYPLHHGGVGAIRSLGRLGVPVYAVTEDRFVPAAFSRYLRGRFDWPTTGTEAPDYLVGGLLDIGTRIGRPTVLLPTDEEAAVLIAEYPDVLSEWFLFPRLADPKLPRRLADKQGLYEICVEQGIAAPWTVSPVSQHEIEEFASTAVFPIVAKNRAAYARRQAPAVSGTTRLDDSASLLRLARSWGARPSVVLQEYLPQQHSRDWFVHGYFDAGSQPQVLFTGIKTRSWPPNAGMTACAYAVSNPELAELTADLCQRIGYHGVVDLDWRLDLRDGRYKLVDFNPRMGAQFRLFESVGDGGEHVDVVRAAYLDLTGQAVPRGPQRTGRRFLLEIVDLPARVAHRHNPPTPEVRVGAGTELAWWARDDPKPFFVMLARLLRPGLDYLRQRFRPRRPAMPVSTRKDKR
jgi:predicted ATP-grasp superfamily ATP-dependent carboligase